MSVFWFDKFLKLVVSYFQIEMDGPPSKRVRTSSPSTCLVCDPEKCIICQKIDPQCNTTSSENGRKRLKEAAGIRKDMVYERLQVVDQNKFYYHVNNNCYKTYVHKKKLEKIVQHDTCVVSKGASLSRENVTSQGKTRRSMLDSRDPVTKPDDVNIFSKPCVICGNVKHKMDYGKFRISEKNRAEAFLKAATILQDDVFTRTCDLQDANAVLAADLYCHKLCIRNYIRKGEKKLHKSQSSSGEQQETNTPGNECERPANDEMKRCGAQLRETILKQDFHLQDKFCDASELEQEYKEILIPNDVATFFSGLFGLENMQKSLTSDDQEEDSNAHSVLFKKILSLYQIIFYILHNGRKRTPLHMMNSEAIYNSCRSKTLLSSLNKFGLTISYDEILRYHSDMASYVSGTNQNHVPIPSHFKPSQFTLGAFDNFDHEETTISGTGGSHDTVMILMQDKSTDVSSSKPNMSDTSVTHRERQFKQELQCQNLNNYIKTAKKPSLSPQYDVSKELYRMNEKDEQRVRRTDAAWVLARMNISDLDNISCIRESSQEQVMPSWSAFNSLITDEKVVPKIIGFLPVLPYPITKYETVYTALRNFQNVLSQLTQTHLPVTCDEGVYHIAREIIMNDPSEFSDLVLCLGSFHMMKVVMGAIGKYVDGSGAETILAETKVFGKNVVNSVLNGTHYTRSLKGLSMLSECIERLQWAEFFKEKGHEQYINELKFLQGMKDAVSERKRDVSKEYLESFLSTSTTMLDDFHEFRREKMEMSETFTFWDRFIQMVGVLKDLVRADREGNWELHLNSVQAALPLFAGCDRINYLRWASLYLEDMRKLQMDAPEVYENFKSGKFVVKRLEGSFNAVGADMCLEQTINRSQKSAGGIIGSTKRKQFVAQWEIIYHEMLAVTNLQREISGVATARAELIVNHEFNQPATQRSEAMIKDVIVYINKHENPVSVPKEKDYENHLILHNIISQEVMSVEVRNNLLKFDENSNKKYETFRRERFVTKQKSIFDTIHRTNLKTFKSMKFVKSKSKVSEKQCKNKLAEAQKLFDIARVRDYDMKCLLGYDLVESSYLFDEDGLMKKPNKSDLCTELEKHLNKEDYVEQTQWTPINTASIIDVMGGLRRISLSKVKTFGEFCSQFLNVTYGICRYSERIDFVFDTYIDGSVKESERIRRYSCTPIDLNEVNAETQLPVHMDSFWSSATNKEKLQELLRDTIMENPKPDKKVVISSMGHSSDIKSCKVIHNACSTAVPELDLNIEEADVRIIPHALHAVCNGAKRVVLLSNDTDVVVLGLNYWDLLKSHGLREIWIRAGVGNTTRYIPLHVLAERLGRETCKVLVAMHHLTGCDSTSKFGTKASGLKANPHHYLKKFGKDPNEIEFALTEEYLVHVYKSGTSCKTLDELRYYLYHHSKKTILDLPPSSHAIKGHILRAFYGTYMELHCLEKVYLDPRNFGYNTADGILEPERHQILIPDDFPLPCKCISCATNRCICRQNEALCCQYCRCQAYDKGCNNLDS